MSSLFTGQTVSAHEVTPSIADVTVTGDVLYMDLTATIEAFVAGVDLNGLDDTNDSANAPKYDEIRALSPEDLSMAFRDVWPAFREQLEITTDQGALQPILINVDVEPQSDLAVPRNSTIHMRAGLPDDTETFQIAWPAEFGALVVRQNDVADPYTGYVSGGGNTGPIYITGGSAIGPFDAFLSYIPVGFDHILPKGLDHILFVLGLFFLSTRMKPLLWQVSAFTLAHTVTLALGALGLVNVPGSIVEPLIAASITFVAVENILSKGFSPWRPVVVFVFGLLHGLGFASVLGDFGLPEDQFVPALIGFNIGVEVGQLTVIAIAFLAVGLWFGNKPWYRRIIAVPASALIGAIGAYWFVERVFLG